MQLKRIEGDLNGSIVDLANGRDRLEVQHELEVTLDEVKDFLKNSLESFSRDI